MHPVPVSSSRKAVITGVPVQLSEAVAVLAEGNDVGLQPRYEAGGQYVNTGMSVSTMVE
jgi:hypothetical protein